MNNSGVEKKIIGDWSLITSQAGDLYSAQDFFAFKAEFLKKELDELKSDVEFGIIEFKQSVLQDTFSFIESLKYDSKDFSRIGHQALRLSYLVYLNLIQKYICTGSIRIRKNAAIKETVKEEPNSHAAVDLKTVIAEVSRLIGEKPELKGNTYIKNILMQVQIYKKELAETQRIAAKMPREKAVGLINNFKTRIAEISDSVSDNFNKLQQEINPAPEKAAEGLISYNLRPLAPLFDAQAKSASMLASRFHLVSDEHYGARDVLLPMLEKKDAFLGQIDKEMAAYAQLEPFDGGKRKASMEFTREIIRILSREAEDAYR